jgi:hypothetical protein
MTDASIYAANVLAVQRAFATQGRNAALAEILRRWPQMNDISANAALDHIVITPMPVVAWRPDPPRDKASG